MMWLTKLWTTSGWVPHRPLGVVPKIEWIWECGQTDWADVKGVKYQPSGMQKFLMVDSDPLNEIRVWAKMVSFNILAGAILLF